MTMKFDVEELYAKTRKVLSDRVHAHQNVLISKEKLVDTEMAAQRAAREIVSSYSPEQLQDPASGKINAPYTKSLIDALVNENEAVIKYREEVWDYEWALELIEVEVKLVYTEIRLWEIAANLGKSE